MKDFKVHWDAVPSPTDNHGHLFALWPSPANDDICFREAGFQDFDDHDDVWDSHASELLNIVLNYLSRYGEPTRCSSPIAFTTHGVSTPKSNIDIRDELEITLNDDQFGNTIVRFGSSGVHLQTDRGHHIYWVSVPVREANVFPGLLECIRPSFVVIHTKLDWPVLRPNTQGTPNQAL